MPAPIGKIPAKLTIDIGLNGESIGAIETTGYLPVTVTGVISGDDVPQIKMNLDEDDVRDVLADALRAAADQIYGAS